MFKLNNTPIGLDQPFTAEDGTQYPSNWLRLASAEERAEIGITEVPDPIQYDDRFYWGVGSPKLLEDRLETKEDGTPLFVQIYDPISKEMVDTTEQVVTKGLKSHISAQIKQTAYSLLSPTDYKLIRKAETGQEVDAETLKERADIRTSCTANLTAIATATTVEELAALQFNWPTKLLGVI